MFNLGRILTLAVVGALVYFGFFAVPPGSRQEGRFDPVTVATAEIASWKAIRAKEEFGAYINLLLMLREHHRYSWFRAGQAAYYLTRAETTFPTLQARYERILPDLEAAAAIERDWIGSAYDPAAVARAQLTWRVTSRLPNASWTEQVVPLIAEEYGVRYGISPGRATDAALRRAQAAQMLDGGADPDWAAMTGLLTDSYRSLQRVLSQPRRTR